MSQTSASSSPHGASVRSQPPDPRSTLTRVPRRARYIAAPLTLAALAAAAGCNALGGQVRSGGDSLFELIAPPTPAEAARWAVDPSSPDNRQQGLLLLANASFGGEPVYIDLYRVALDDDDAAVRAAAIRALGLHGGPAEGERVLELLTPREDVLVRREAARTLARIHVPEAAPQLIVHLDRADEPDAQVRALAAEALGQHRQARVVQALIGALPDTRLLVGSAARSSLTTLTGKDFGYEPEPWLRWTSRTADYFEGATPFYYTVYQRDRRFLEYIVPWLEPPNEIASTPAGMPIEASAPPPGAPPSG